MTAVNLRYSLTPMNFSSYRELAMDSERAQLFNQIAAIPYLSNQFKLQKFLGLTESEIKQNEELWRQENDYEKYKDGDETNLKDLGIRPQPDAAVNPALDVDVGGLPPTEPEGDINTIDDAGDLGDPNAPGGVPGV